MYANSSIYWCVGLERFLVPYRDILVKKIEEGKRGRETAPEVIVEEVQERNADMDRSSWSWYHLYFFCDGRSSTIWFSNLLYKIVDELANCVYISPVDMAEKNSVHLDEPMCWCLCTLWCLLERSMVDFFKSAHDFIILTMAHNVTSLKTVTTRWGAVR